jgi:hypothetical protein
MSCLYYACIPAQPYANNMLQIIVFWIITLCRVIVSSDVSEDLVAVIFRVTLLGSHGCSWIQPPEPDYAL